MPTALSQTHIYIYFIYKLNLHGCHHVIAFSLEKTSSSFQVKREEQQVAPEPDGAAVTTVHCIGAFLSPAPPPTPHCVTGYTRTHAQYVATHTCTILPDTSEFVFCTLRQAVSRPGIHVQRYKKAQWGSPAPSYVSSWHMQVLSGFWFQVSQSFSASAFPELRNITLIASQPLLY